MEYELPRKQLLEFISNEDLYFQTARVLDASKSAVDNATANLYKNAVDPFSAVFDAFCQGISLSDWLKLEAARQIQKTLQNAIGSFHQEILGSTPGWHSLGVGQVVDLKNDNKKIIAEIKNKFNTTKGNHKVAIYDDFSKGMRSNYVGYTAYYVEIISKDKKAYDKVFAPSDNNTHRRRRVNKHIRVIDGKSFYHLVTGDEFALKKLYLALPQVIGDILGVPVDKIAADGAFHEIFDKAF